MRGLKVFYCLHISMSINVRPLLHVLRIFTFQKINLVFATNPDFIIPLSLKPPVIDFRYFKLQILFDSFGSNNLSLNYQRFTSSGWMGLEHLSLMQYLSFFT